MLRFAYNTNGFLAHRLEDALRIIADCGYQGVHLTLDVHHLDPFRLRLGEVSALERLLRTAGLAPGVETGGRFLLDPRRKHWPTLLTPEEGGRRLEMLERAVGIARDLGARCLSFWSGAYRPQEGAPEVCFQRLVDRVGRLARRAEVAGILLGFEPEPGMLVEDLAGWRRLREAVGHDALRLTFDIGHAAITEPVSIPEALRREASHVVNVHLEDVRDGVHEHLFFGEGELEFRPVLAALREIEFDGLAGVELSRHSHRAPEVAEQALRFLLAEMPPP